MGKRCTGRCCKSFRIPYSPEQLREFYAAWASGDAQRKTVSDIHLIYPMVTPLEECVGGWTYSCKHLDTNNNCSIYDNRPDMCRNFPYEKRCPFPECEWSRVSKESFGRNRRKKHGRIKRIKALRAK